MPPVDIDDLADIKQVINDGIRQFEADAPPTGWQWRKRILQVNISNLEITGTADAADSTSITDATLEDTYDSDDDLNGYWCYILTGTGAGSYAQIDDYTASGGVVDVLDWLDQYGNAGGTDPAADSTFIITQYETVAGDIGRYPLPENFGGEASGPITYDKNADHHQFVGWASEAIIRARRQASEDTGYPFLAAIRMLEPASAALGPKRRYELVLYPDPVQDDTLEFPFLLEFDEINFESGVATGASTTTVADTSRDEQDDVFNDWVASIIGGTGRGSYATVTDYDAGTGAFTVADWLKPSGAAAGTDPAANSIYFVQPANNLHPAGMKFDDAVEASCLSKAEQFFEKFTPGHVEYYTQKALPKAYEADARSLMFTKVGKRPTYTRVWSEVTKVTTL